MGLHRRGLGAMLQSPFFLYHWERAEPLELGGTGPQASAPWQVSSRLSYFLWQEPPDEALREAAASGTLLTDQGFESQARRMVSHERARRALPGLFAQLFDLQKILSMPKNPGLFGDFDEDQRRSMLRSAELFFEDAIFGAQGHYTGMLTALTAFINRHTAARYGLNPEDFSDKWDRKELDASQRAGLLTLPVHADASEGNPIFRGVSFQQQVLCTQIAAPTGDVPPLLSGSGSKTLRQMT